MTHLALEAMSAHRFCWHPYANRVHDGTPDDRHRLLTKGCLRRNPSTKEYADVRAPAADAPRWSPLMYRLRALLAVLAAVATIIVALDSSSLKRNTVKLG